MAAQPYVTVVIAATAPGPLVQETVRSVRKQSSRAWEIVIVATEAAGKYASLTQELSSGEAAKLGRSQLAVVRNPVPDISSAWNTGVQCSRAEAILPLKAGDTLQPRAVELISDALRNHPAPYVFFDHNIKGGEESSGHKGVFDLPRLLRENYIDRALAVRRDVWNDAGDWDYIALGDSSWNFVLKLAHRGYWGCYLPEALVDMMPGSIEKPEQLVYNAPDPRRAVERLHPYFFSPEARMAVRRVWEPSICIVVQSYAEPFLANQTVRDFQVLRNVSEQEALERSRSANFLWLSDGHPLRPYAAEECIWGLRSAEWVTWSDTGEAPPPSVRECAGPLGVSRWALETEEAKRSGEVWRLPWRCRYQYGEFPAAQYHSDSPTDACDVAGGNFSILAPPPMDHLVAEAKVTLSGKLARRFGGLSDWRKHPVDLASRLLPSRLREGLGGVAVQRTFDVDGASIARASRDSSRRISEPVEYIPPPADPGRSRVALFTPHLGAGGVEQSLLELSRQLKPDLVESFLCAAKSADSAWIHLWRDCVTHLYDIGRLLPPQGLTPFAVSLARNWQPSLFVLNGLANFHGLLTPLREAAPTATVAVAYHGSAAERNLFSGSLDWLAAVDCHIVSDDSAAKWLYEMTVPEASISVIPPGIDCQCFDPKSVDPGPWRERLGVDKKQRIILFAGRLIEANNPLLMLDIATRLTELRSDKGFHFVLAGDGPLQESLRSKITARDLAAVITLTGTVADIRGLLAASTMLILPATRRDLPQIALEALAMEMPVIARRDDPIAGIVDTGCLELVGDDEEEDVGFARAIDNLLGIPNRRVELGVAGRQLAQTSYPIEKTREAWKAWLASTVR